jgi:rare lipoprotein A
MDLSVTVARDGFEAARKGAKTIEKHVKELPDAAVVTARVLITAEERLRQRVASSLRVVVATLFLMVSGLISLGANAAVAAASAVAKKVTPQPKERVHRAKKAKSHHIFHLHASHVVKGHQRGIASWYGDQFNHRRTASGVRFNKLDMMAAHRSLPFGTRVKVTNLTNHKSCVVKITDRGPFKPGRIIDLSEAAAHKLDMASAGTAQVELEIIGTETIFQDIASETFEDANFERSRPVFDHIPSIPDRALDSILSSAQEQATR